MQFCGGTKARRATRPSREAATFVLAAGVSPRSSGKIIEPRSGGTGCDTVSSGPCRAAIKRRARLTALTLCDLRAPLPTPFRSVSTQTSQRFEQNQSSSRNVRAPQARSQDSPAWSEAERWVDRQIESQPRRGDTGSVPPAEAGSGSYNLPTQHSAFGSVLGCHESAPAALVLAAFVPPMQQRSVMFVHSCPRHSAQSAHKPRSVLSRIRVVAETSERRRRGARIAQRGAKRNAG